MRRLLFILTLLILVPVLISATMPGGGPVIKDSEEGSKVSLMIPGFLVRLGGRFIPESEDPELSAIVQKLGTVRIKVTEGSFYRSDIKSDDFERYQRRILRDGFDQLIMVKGVEESVFIGIRQDRHENIRKLAVLVDEGQESFVHVRLNCKIGLDELGRLIQSGSIEGLSTEHMALKIPPLH